MPGIKLGGELDPLGEKSENILNSSFLVGSVVCSFIDPKSKRSGTSSAGVATFTGGFSAAPFFGFVGLVFFAGAGRGRRFFRWLFRNLSPLSTFFGFFFGSEDSESLESSLSLSESEASLRFFFFFFPFALNHFLCSYFARMKVSRRRMSVGSVGLIPFGRFASYLALIWRFPPWAMKDFASFGCQSSKVILLTKEIWTPIFL